MKVSFSDADSRFDSDHIWHPYTSLNNPLPVYPVQSANGVRLTLGDGRRVIDGMASWWCAIHGYNHPRINQALEDQLKSMAHVMFGGLTHRPAIDLCRTLVDLAPESLSKVFLADSGSVAVEVAIKMALQYWQSKGLTSRRRLLTVKSGYHGDTFGAMSVCDPVNGMHHLFSGNLTPQLFAPAPPLGFDTAIGGDEMQAMAQLLERHQDEVAAVIIEPVVQGAGGMRIYSPEYLRHLKRLCERYECLLIFDEIATGFGRTGRLFAAEHAGIQPDIMCLGKALTGGYLTLAATLCSDKVVEGINRDHGGVLMHGPTYMANPLACAAANASIELLVNQDWQQKIHTIEAILRENLQACMNFDSVKDVRVLGAIGVVEMKRAVNVARAQAYLVDKGLWLRPFGSLLYMMPPYVIAADDLQNLCEGVFSLIQSASFD